MVDTNTIHTVSICWVSTNTCLHQLCGQGNSSKMNGLRFSNPLGRSRYDMERNAVWKEHLLISVVGDGIDYGSKDGQWISGPRRNPGGQL